MSSINNEGLESSLPEESWESLRIARTHPDFQEQMTTVIEELAAEESRRQTLIPRAPWATVHRTHGSLEEYVTALGDRCSGLRSMDSWRDHLKKDTLVLQTATGEELTGKTGLTAKEDILRMLRLLDANFCPGWVTTELLLSHSELLRSSERYIVASFPFETSYGAATVPVIDRNTQNPDVIHVGCSIARRGLRNRFHGTDRWIYTLPSE